jgi:hypothetical protein
MTALDRLTDGDTSATQPQLGLFEAARIGVEPPDRVCPHFPGAECRWHPSCSAEGCWRQEAERSGRPLFGIGPRGLALAVRPS